MSARTYHYRPNAGYRSKDASAWAASLEEALSGWISAAVGGKKPHRLAATNSPSTTRSRDEITCDVAHALAAAVEWDGFSIAHQLKLRGWPADVELVQLCNVWSCALVGKIRARLQARGPDLRGGM